MPKVKITAPCARCSRTDLQIVRRVCATCYAFLNRTGRLDELPVTSPGPSARCAEEGCLSEVGRAGAKGYCPRHYQQLTKGINGITVSARELSDEERFRQAANPIGSCPCGCACQRWKGGIHETGYGTFYLNRKTQLAHRVAWEYANNLPVPDGLIVDHVAKRGCVHTDCVRADHLEAVTYEENAMRKKHDFEGMARGGRKGSLHKALGLPLHERFALNVSKEACPCGCACERWKGTVNKKTGYGSISVKDRTELAHRVAWELANGRPVPPGLIVDHVFTRGCVHRDCVSFGHLEAVTLKENAERAAPARREKNKSTAIKTRALLLLADETPRTVSEIAREMQGAYSSVYEALRAAVAEGTVVKDGTRYRLARPASPPAPLRRILKACTDCYGSSGCIPRRPERPRCTSCGQGSSRR